MAPSTSTPDHNAAFLYGCINKTTPEQDVYESLGLFSQTLGRRKGPDFPKNEANELRSRIKEIAQAFLVVHREDPGDLRAKLENEDIFSNEIQEIEDKFGQAIWGKQVGHSRSFKAQEKFPDELDWDKSRDRVKIRFYIRCWIVRLTVADIIATPRKKNVERRPRRVNLSDDDDEDSGSSGSSTIPFRAPEPPRLYSDIENQRENGQITDFGRPRVGAQSRDTDLSINVERRMNSPPNRTLPLSPNKRKAPDVNGQRSPGKLQKVSKPIRTGGVPFRPQQQSRDPYSIPRSPTLPLSAIRPFSINEQQTQQQSSCDTDATYVPPSRGFTAETETICDADEMAADQTDSLLRSAFPGDESMQDGDLTQTVAGSSSTYQHSVRGDSAIIDAQNRAMQIMSGFVESHGTLATANKAATQASASAAQTGTLIQTLDTWEKKSARRELFRLLLSFLNSINQFAKHSYDIQAEERMNTLLKILWLHDADNFRERLGDDFPRLDNALTSWMGMRSRLAKFQSRTGFVGTPGEEWRAYLQGINSLGARAQACIAFDELKGVEDQAQTYLAETFEDDLAIAFDLMTRVKGCNGPEEFSAIRVYNQVLLEWVKEEDSQES